MNDIKILKNWSNNEKGVTIIEILMAMSILAVGILAVVAMQTSSARGNSTSLMSTNGLLFAVNQLETLMDRDWTHADLDADNNTHTVDRDPYTIEWDVIDPGVINNTKTINMTVRWSNWGLTKRIFVQYIIPKIT
jgi:prepilin-type N-terminal cleavage/methylation domain-containing protein